MDTNDGLEEKAKTGNILESTRVLSVFYPRGPAVSLGQLIVARGSDAKGGSRLPPSDPPPPIPLSPFFLLAIPSSIFHLSPSLVFYLHYYNTSLRLPFNDSFLSRPRCPISLLHRFQIPLRSSRHSALSSDPWTVNNNRDSVDLQRSMSFIKR